LKKEKVLIRLRELLSCETFNVSSNQGIFNWRRNVFLQVRFCARVQLQWRISVLQTLEIRFVDRELANARATKNEPLNLCKAPALRSDHQRGEKHLLKSNVFKINPARKVWPT